jgi:hypothetical protein
MPETAHLLERLAWLRLIRSEKVGPLTFAGLLRRHGSAVAALRETPGLASPTEAEAQAEIDQAKACGARLLLKADADYPPLLKRLDEAPPVLFALGDAAITQRPSVAIVSARNASALGQRFAKQLAADLGAAGFTIVSGLARGIDAAAHKGSLASGTVAVLGTGIDMPFPPENKALYGEVAAAGLLLSQFPPGAPALPRNFPRRHRERETEDQRQHAQSRNLVGQVGSGVAPPLRMPQADAVAALRHRQQHGDQQDQHDPFVDVIEAGHGRGTGRGFEAVALCQAARCRATTERRLSESGPQSLQLPAACPFEGSGDSKGTVGRGKPDEQGRNETNRDQTRTNKDQTASNKEQSDRNKTQIIFSIV